MNEQQKRVVGLLFALFVIMTSINAPLRSEQVDYYYPYWRPLQIISDDNRWICSGLALGLIAICWFARTAANAGWGEMAAILITLHVLILAKNFNSVGAPAFVFFVGVVLLLMATRLVATI